MKHLNLFIKMCSFLLLMLLAFSCTKEDPVTMDNFNSDLSKINSGVNDPLMPTGDSTIDTKNLQTAINTLGTGETLYLGQGTFMVHASLTRQSSYPNSPNYISEPFNGTIQGAGKGKTIIKSVRGPAGEDFAPWIDPVFFGTPSTLIFSGETYTGIKDMTFEADSEICSLWNYGGDLWTKGLLNYVLLENSSDCINVYFKGSLDSSGNPENAHLFEVWGGVNTTHNIKSCEFENGWLDMLTYGLQANSTINIGGNASEKMTFTNSIYPGIQILACGNSSINVSNIETRDAPGFWFAYHTPNTKSNITISHSDINPRTGSNFAGIEIWATRGEVSTEFSHNKIHSEDSWFWGPIFSEGVKNAVLKNNKFTGRGSAAIYYGVRHWYPGKVSLVGNNFENWETSINPWGFKAAPIWLGPYITDSFVVGGNNKVNVFDEPGYDDFWNPLPPDENGNAQTYDEYGNIVSKNNIFTGVNNMHINIGQDIRDIMKQMADEKKAKKNRHPFD